MQALFDKLEMWCKDKNFTMVFRPSNDDFHGKMKSFLILLINCNFVTTVKRNGFERLTDYINIIHSDNKYKKLIECKRFCVEFHVSCLFKTKQNAKCCSITPQNQFRISLFLLKCTHFAGSETSTRSKLILWQEITSKNLFQNHYVTLERAYSNLA